MVGPRFHPSVHYVSSPPTHTDPCCLCGCVGVWVCGRVGVWVLHHSKVVYAQRYGPRRWSNCIFDHLRLCTGIVPPESDRFPKPTKQKGIATCWVAGAGSPGAVLCRAGGVECVSPSNTHTGRQWVTLAGVLVCFV